MAKCWIRTLMLVAGLGILPSAGWSFDGGLSGLLEAARVHNREIRAARAAWNAALARVEGSDRLPDPRLSAKGFLVPLETRGGPARYSVGISQTLPAAGKRAIARSKAGLFAEEKRAELDGVMRDVIYRIQDAWFDYAHQVQAISVTRESIELVRHHETILSARYKTSSERSSSLIRVQVALGRLENRLLSLEDRLSPIRRRILSLVGDDFPLPEPPALLPVLSIDLPERRLFEEMERKSPLLRKWRRVTAAREKDMALARKERIPDVTIGLEMTEVGGARAPGVPDSGENPVAVSLSIPLPLQKTAIASRVLSAGALVLAAREQLEDAARRLEADLEEALFRYRDAGRNLALHADTLIPQARQLLRVSLEELSSGTGTSIALADAERGLLELKLGYLAAVSERARQVAQIERLVGRTLPVSRTSARFGGTP